MIVAFEIVNFKGIAHLAGEPRGHSLTLVGENGAGKSTTTEAFLWGLGGDAQGEPVGPGGERGSVRLTIDDAGAQLLVARTKKVGGKATLTVTDVPRDGEPKRAPYSEPTTLLAKFRQGIARNAFSQLDEKGRVALVKRLAPGLDTSDLDEEAKRVYAERTQIGREADDLKAQADGVLVPPDAKFVGGEKEVVDLVDLGPIYERKAALATKTAENDRVRDGAARAKEELAAAARALADAQDGVKAAEEALRRAQLDLVEAQKSYGKAESASTKASALAARCTDPDAATIDGQIADAKEKNRQHRLAIEEHNRQARAAQREHEAHVRARDEQARLAGRAEQKRAAYTSATKQLRALEEAKTSRIAAAACPVPGIALSSDGVTYPGVSGPVPVPQLSTGERITLDVLVAAALGLRMIPVPGWGEVDAKHRQAINALAAQKGIQLLRELTTASGPLEIVVEEGDANAALPVAEAEEAVDL